MIGSFTKVEKQNDRGFTDYQSVHGTPTTWYKPSESICSVTESDSTDAGGESANAKIRKPPRIKDTPSSVGIAPLLAGRAWLWSSNSVRWNGSHHAYRRMRLATLNFFRGLVDSFASRQRKLAVERVGREQSKLESRFTDVSRVANWSRQWRRPSPNLQSNANAERFQRSMR